MHGQAAPNINCGIAGFYNKSPPLNMVYKDKQPREQSPFCKCVRNFGSSFDTKLICVLGTSEISRGRGGGGGNFKFGFGNEVTHPYNGSEIC